jgi:hypothetical protein
VHYLWEVAKLHNIIQVHNSVLWDLQYSMKYTSHSA